MNKIQELESDWEHMSTSSVLHNLLILDLDIINEFNNDVDQHLLNACIEKASFFNITPYKYLFSVKIFIDEENYKDFLKVSDDLDFYIMHMNVVFKDLIKHLSNTDKYKYREEIKLYVDLLDSYII